MDSWNIDVIILKSVPLGSKDAHVNHCLLSFSRKEILKAIGMRLPTCINGKNEGNLLLQRVRFMACLFKQSSGLDLLQANTFVSFCVHSSHLPLTQLLGPV